jgi:hypothetical protein
MAERSEVRLKTLRNIGAAISEKTRPIWMLGLLTTGTLALVGVAGAAGWATSMGLAYGGDVLGDQVVNPENKLGRKNAPSFARDLREAVAMPGKLIGKIKRW